MAEETYKLATSSAGWTKSRRNGNDEVPAERSAVKVIRTVRSDSATSFGSYVHAPETKSVTKISQLVYTPKPKNVTTKAVLRSMHIIKTDKTQWLKDIDKSKVPFRHNEASKNVDEKKVIATSKNIGNGETSKGNVHTGRDKGSESARSYVKEKKANMNEPNNLNAGKKYADIFGFSENEEFNGGFTKIKQISNYRRPREDDIHISNEILQKKTEFQNDAAEIQELMQRISSLENGNPKVNNKIENKKKEIQNDIAEINEMMKNFASKNYNNNDNNEVEYNNLPLDESQGVTPKSVNIPLKRQATAQHMIRSKTEIATMKISKNQPKSPNTDLLTQRTISKSAANLPIEICVDKQSPCRKKKSYDPDKARKFMKEQRQKRKENKEKSPIKEFKKEQIDKDEIRKRLDNLRKNTLKILDKNVKRVRKKGVRHEPPSPEKSSKNKQRRGKFSPQQKESIRSTKMTPEKKKILKPSNFGKEKTKKPFVVAGTSKKIGILRKPNPEVSSFSAALEDIKMNKENFLLTDLTKNLPRTPIVSTRVANDIDHPISAKSELSQGFVSGRIINPKNIPPPPPLPPPLSAHSVSKKDYEQPKKNEAEDDNLKLTVPDYKLEKKVSVSEKSIQVNPPTPSIPEKAQVPFWLKPTPVHVYPYNFIMAVRKKLEAVTNPVIFTNNDFHQKSTVYKDNEKLDKDRKQSAARRRLIEEADINEPASTKGSSSDSNIKRKSSHSSNKYTEDFTSEGDSKSSDKQQSQSHSSSAKAAAKSLLNNNGSKSLSEIQSNFSSISVHVPESQTISEVSAIKSEVVIKNHTEFTNEKIPTKIKTGTVEDDTTISSSIFSSPEKKSKNTEKDNKQERELDVSPLSVENINNMQIKSKSRNENITMSRGDSLRAPSLKLETISSQQQQRQQPIVETKKDVVDFTQLLEDFNRSLSQVIEVNEQLKTTLVNPKPVAENKKIPSTTTGSIKSKPEDYSSDFEEQVTTTTASKKSTKSDSDKTEKHSSDYILDIKQSSGSNHTSTSLKSSLLEVNHTSKTASDEIDTNVSDYTQRIQHSINESTSTNEYYKLPTDRLKTATPSRGSVVSEEFLDSIEETSKVNSKSNQSEEKSIEGIYNEDPAHPDNMSAAQYSKDSLDFPKENLSQKEFINSHINISRGDFLHLLFPKEYRPEIELPPVYPISMPSRSPRKKSQARKVFNTSIGSEIYAVFNQSDIELSVTSQNRSLSESSINYSSLGMYEQLLQTETSKSEHLSALLKIREKSLIDRTRGQIAWLEVRKEKYKAKGLTLQISAIKKKQRAILLKMEKERDEIKRILHSQESNNTPTKPKQKVLRHNLPGNVSDVALRKNISTSSNTNRIIKGYEVETSQTLEMILQKREEELRKRRTQVERLVEWHQRLDKEENEVFQLEQMLFNCNSQIQPQSPKDGKMQKKIIEIDKSLRELQNISTRSEGSSKDSDYVRTSGIKLNKLWRRLTGQKDAKFDITRKYKLSKNDLEEIYEEAKLTVLRDFGRVEEMKLLLEQSKLDHTSTSGLSLNGGDDVNQVPKLNLNFSSNQSETDQTVSSLNKDEIILVELNQPEEVNTHSEITSKKSTYGFERISKTLESLSDSEVQKRSPKNIFSLANESIPEINTNSHSIQYMQTGEEITTNSTEEKDSELKSDASIQLIETRSFEKSRELSFDESTNKKSSPSKSTYSESEKIDTVAEISSISPDSNEFSLKIKPSLEKSPTDVSDKVLDLVPSATELSRNSVIEDIQTLSRTSVIVSRLSSVEKEQETTENSRSIQTSTSLQEEVETTFPTYDIQTSTQSQSNKSVTTEQNVLTYKTVETSKTISPEINATSEDIQKENNLNNGNDKFFENEFSDNDTQIEEISLPKFELTLEDSRLAISEDVPSEYSQIEDSSKYSQHSNRELNTSELEKRLIDLDESLKGLNETFERALSPEKSPTSSRSRSPTKNYLDDEKENKSNGQDFSIKPPIRNILVNNENASGLMPDIINEVELRRQQQILLENDIKHIEQAVPYMFLRREIPNKPPPPYVPPAHGSPMTTIFPSEERIKDITFRRIRELYEEIIKTDTNSHIKYPSVLDENITNIYERIILDICKEWMDDVRPTLTANPESYKNSLALFNPPNRLICFQETMYKRIRKLLAMNKKGSPKDISSCYDRRKIEYVNEILIQELYEEDHKWTNFDLEEDEVRKSVVDEIFDDLVNESINEYLYLIGHNNENETVVDFSGN